MVVGGFSDSSIRIHDVEAAAAHRARKAASDDGDPAAADRSESERQRTQNQQQQRGANDLDDMDWEGDGVQQQQQQQKTDDDDKAKAAKGKKQSNKATRDVEPRRASPGHREELICLWGHSGPVYSVSWAANERYLLSSSADCTVRLWSMELGTNLVAYRGHNYPVWAVEASPQVNPTLSLHPVSSTHSLLDVRYEIVCLIHYGLH
eukprot:scaffold674874_cov46-Prasinocladus_malaysianus.AAC.1